MPSHTLRLASFALLLTACESSPAPSNTARDAATDVITDASRDASFDARSDSTDDAHAHDVTTADATDVRDGPPPQPTMRCPDGNPLPYPDGDALTLDQPFPNWSFATADGTVRMADFYTPCATRPKVIVLRLMAAWSGLSRLHAAHTRDLLARPDADRLQLLDVLPLSQENLPATTADIPFWQGFYNGARTTVVLDPTYRLRTLFMGGGRLPVVLLIDPRSMRIVRTLDAPETAEVGWTITAALARFDGRDPPVVPELPLYDGRLSPDAWELVQAMTLPGAPPPDPSNRVADNPAAARLGQALFVDPQLSLNGMISCATCHVPERFFTDGHRTGIGQAVGGRNTPTLVVSAHLRWQFWDGRADSLWSQALGPIENPGEMASSRLATVHYVYRQYNAQYRAIFGDFPALDDARRFPAEGMPGAPAWEAMSADDQVAANTVFANVGKSIAAYERTLRLAPSPFDRYARGDVNAMSPDARDGLRRFMEFGCAQCHFGPTLSNDSFHNLRLGTGRLDEMADPGRYDGVSSLGRSVFRVDGRYSDSSLARLGATTPTEWMRGQFHTPTLRGVSATGPWGHGGTLPDMTAVMRHYADILVARPETATVGELDPHLGSFHTDAISLGTLSTLMQAMTPSTTP